MNGYVLIGQARLDRHRGNEVTADRLEAINGQIKDMHYLRRKDELDRLSEHFDSRKRKRPVGRKPTSAGKSPKAAQK